MERYLAALLCLLFSNLAICSSNLDAFNIAIGNKTYSGYVEPDRSTGQALPSYVIYMMPNIHITKVVARDRLGMRISLSNLETATGKVGASVDFKLVNSLPSPIEKQQLLLELHPEDRRQTFKAIMPWNNPTPEQQAAHNSAQADLAARSAGDQNGAVSYRLSQYRFVSATPKSLKLELFIGNDLYSTKEYGDSVVATGSTFSLAIPRTEDYYAPSLILQKDFSIRATFKMKLTNFQMAKAFFFDRDFSSYFVDAFKEEVTRSSSSSTGFLFWSTRHSSLTRYAKDMINSGQYGGSKTIVESVLVDVEDKDMIERVDAFLFPEVSKQEVILNHMRAAEEASKNNNAELAKIHSDYSELLKDQIANSQAKNAEVNAMKALAALSQENISAFFANGFAMNSGYSSGRLSYRVLNRFDASHEDVRKLNQLVLNTIWVNHVVEAKASEEEKIEESPRELLNGYDFSNQAHISKGLTGVKLQCWLRPLQLAVDLLDNHNVMFSSTGGLAGSWFKANANSPCLYNLRVNGFTYCIDSTLYVDRRNGNGHCKPCSRGLCN